MHMVIYSELLNLEVSKNKMLACTSAVLEPDLTCRIVLVVAMEMWFGNSPWIEKMFQINEVHPQSPC